MQLQAPLKPVTWVGPSRHELRALPREVQRTMGIALWQAQLGRVDPSARLMRGARFHGEAIYIVCAFPKKATSGIKTPKRLLSLVEKRLRDARSIHAFEARR
jgi:phage-related protein